MEVRPFQDAYDADMVHRSCRLFFMIFEDQKLLSGDDTGGSLDIVVGKKLKFQSGGKEINLTSNQSAHRLDSNGVNNTPIWVWMKRIELVKFGLTFDD